MKPPFVLSCIQCCAGDGINCKRETVRAGWKDVHRDITGLIWNDLGLCPDCQLEEAVSSLKGIARRVFSANDKSERPYQEFPPNKPYVEAARDREAIYQDLLEVAGEIREAEAMVEKQRKYKLVKRRCHHMTL